MQYDGESLKTQVQSRSKQPAPRPFTGTNKEWMERYADYDYMGDAWKYNSSCIIGEETLFDIEDKENGVGTYAEEYKNNNNEGGNCDG